MPYQILHYKGNELVSVKVFREKERAEKEVERLRAKYPNDDISIRPLYSVGDDGIKAS